MGFANHFYIYIIIKLAKITTLFCVFWPIHMITVPIIFWLLDPTFVWDRTFSRASPR